MRRLWTMVAGLAMASCRSTPPVVMPHSLRAGESRTYRLFTACDVSVWADSGTVKIAQSGTRDGDVFQSEATVSGPSGYVQMGMKRGRGDIVVEAVTEARFRIEIQ